VTTEKVEIWVPTQNGEAALAAASAAAEVDLSRVEVHKTHLGGGFGRRGAFHDFVTQAVLIARQIDRPVQLIWSREEDMQHDFFRPVSVVRFTAGLDKADEPIAFKARVAAHSIMNFVRPNEVKNGLDRHSLGGIDDMPYEFPNLRVEYAMRNTHVPVGFWRAPSHNQNGFYLECFIDELAHAAGQDPYQFRRKLLANKPKDRAVLDAAAQNAGWGKPLPSGVHRGIAMMKSYDSYCAQVAEVSVSDKGEVHVQRVVCAVDPGHVVNPDTIDAQVESAVVYGLTAALYGDITIRNGRVQQSNFHDYPMLRIHEMPKVEAYAVPSGGFWGGMGEPPLPPLAPAVCNAVFAATGKRVRSLPLKQHDLRSS
jgi:isoquinoline 1-oxidoreductase subunit beta